MGQKMTPLFKYKALHLLHCAFNKGTKITMNLLIKIVFKKRNTFDISIHDMNSLKMNDLDQSQDLFVCSVQYLLVLYSLVYF